MDIKDSTSSKRVPKRATLGVKNSMKDRLYRNHTPNTPSKSYDGFLCQVVDLREQVSHNLFIKANITSVESNA